MKDVAIFILTVWLICAACCGVTVDGKHYGVSCSEKNGLMVETGTPK